MSNNCIQKFWIFSILEFSWKFFFATIFKLDFETGLFLKSLDIQNLENSVEPQIDKDLCQLAVQFYTLETNQEI